MSPVRVAAIRVRPARADGRADVEVRLEDGARSRFTAALPGAARGWTAGPGFSFGPPVLFVSSLDADAIEEAVRAMADEMGGYWLRYYHRERGVRGKAAGRSRR